MNPKTPGKTIKPLSAAEFFGWKRHPFVDSGRPQGELVFTAKETEMLQAAQALLLYNKNFAITGVSGIGKSTFSRHLIGSLDQRSFRPVWLAYAGFNRAGVLRALADRLGLDLGKRGIPSLLKIQAFLLAAQKEPGSPFPVMIIDDAQHLEPESMNDLLALTAHPEENRAIASLVLIGDDILNRQMRLSSMRPTSSRMACIFRFEPISDTDMAAVIKERLAAVDGPSDLFDSEAIELMAARCRGNKRDLLNLATTLCVEAHIRQERVITSNLILTSSFCQTTG